jgi:hypothetical membrane protein
MLHEFLNQHPGLACFLFALFFLFMGLSAYKRGLTFFAFSHWFLGLLIVSCGIAMNCLFLDVFRWPIAAVVFIAGTYAILRFKKSVSG